MHPWEKVRILLKSWGPDNSKSTLTFYFWLFKSWEINNLLFKFFPKVQKPTMAHFYSKSWRTNFDIGLHYHWILKIQKYQNTSVTCFVGHPLDSIFSKIPYNHRLHQHDEVQQKCIISNYKLKRNTMLLFKCKTNKSKSLRFI